MAEDLTDFDSFFYHDQLDVRTQIKVNLQLGTLQNKRTMFYFRKWGAGVQSKENHPNTIMLWVMLRYNIAAHVAYDNTLVSDGSNDAPDRRVAVSQNSVQLVRGETGELDVNIQYIPYIDYKIPESLNLPVGGLS